MTTIPSTGPAKDRLKAALPKALRRAIAALKRTEPGARTTLVRLWLQRALRVKLG